MTRRPVIIGNWKMELSHKASLELIRALAALLTKEECTSDIVVCPSFPSLPDAAAAAKKIPWLKIGAQTVHRQERGAFTGSVAASQITPFATWCIVGHSEVRAATNEGDDEIGRKAMLLLKHGLTPIICLGETADEHAADQTIGKITAQIESLLQHVSRTNLPKIVIAYEPIWAISVNHPSESVEPATAAEMSLFMRKMIANRYDGALAERVRIIYGGSVNEKTASQYVAEPSIDGVLVGSASTHPLSFAEIMRTVQATSQRKA